MLSLFIIVCMALMSAYILNKIGIAKWLSPYVLAGGVFVLFAVAFWGTKWTL